MIEGDERLITFGQSSPLPVYRSECLCARRSMIACQSSQSHALVGRRWVTAIQPDWRNIGATAARTIGTSIFTNECHLHGDSQPGSV